MSAMRFSITTLPVLSALLLCGCYVESGPPAADPTYVESESPPPPPPPPPPEAVPVSPGPNYVWVAGYHRWNGRSYDWQRGHYEPRPRANAQYVAAHWEKRGRGHAWVDGHWQ